MVQLFSDLPEAIRSTQEISERCHVELDFTTKHYPVFIPPSMKDSQKKGSNELRIEENVRYLQQLCQDALPLRYTEETLQHVQAKHPDKDPLKLVHDRLAYELEIIVSKGIDSGLSFAFIISIIKSGSPFNIN